jgi:hypothetical protein
MADLDEPTLDTPDAFTVLVIACPSAVANACQSAVLPIGAKVHHAERVGDAATAAARVRPLVLVMPQSIYDFDQQEFDHLARDVGGVVMTLPDEGLTKSALKNRLLDCMSEASRIRG